MKKEYKHLFNDYYVSNDAYNIILSERTVNVSGKNIGKEKFTPFAFFSNVTTFKKHLMNMYAVANIKNVDLEAYLEYLDLVITSIERIGEE